MERHGSHTGRDFGMKRLSADNWNQIDPTNLMFGGVPDPASLIDHLMTQPLSERVPDDIAKLFEVARSAMCYGYLFYPLWTLAAEQLLRVGDAAVSLRCRQLGASRAVNTFEKKIEFLKDRLPPADLQFDWNALRRLRNTASHPAEQMIVTPGMSVPLVEHIANAINRLFAEA